MRPFGNCSNSIYVKHRYSYQSNLNAGDLNNIEHTTTSTEKNLLLIVLRNISFIYYLKIVFIFKSIYDCIF